MITNASLLWRPDVRRDLEPADWVSVKVDVGCASAWKAMNRPHAELSFDRVRDGLLAFAKDFPGTLATETMLVRGINDGEENCSRMAELMARLRPSVAFLAVPIRSPPGPRRSRRTRPP